MIFSHLMLLQTMVIVKSILSCWKYLTVGEKRNFLPQIRALDGPQTKGKAEPIFTLLNLRKVNTMAGFS